MIIWGNHSPTMYPDIENAFIEGARGADVINDSDCLLYTSPSPRDRSLSRMPSSA